LGGRSSTAGKYIPFMMNLIDIREKNKKGRRREKEEKKRAYSTEEMGVNQEKKLTQGLRCK